MEKIDSKEENLTHGKPSSDKNGQSSKGALSQSSLVTPPEDGNQKNQVVDTLADDVPTIKPTSPKRKGRSNASDKQSINSKKSPRRKRNLLELQQSIQALQEENDYLRDIIQGTIQTYTESGSSSQAASPMSRTYSLPSFSTDPLPSVQTLQVEEPADVPIIEVALDVKPLEKN